MSAARGRILISLDLEGLPYITSPAQLGWGRSGWSEGRRVATWVARIVAEEITARGYSVVLADSHGEMRNVDPFELPRGVTIVRGYPRPRSMISGAEGAAAAIFLGYHGGAGTGSVLSHTWAGLIVRAEACGLCFDETLLNAAALGELGVPVVMVAGSEAAVETAERLLPWAVTVTLTRSHGYLAAESPDPATIEARLRRATAEAVARLEAGEAKPLKLPCPPSIVVEWAKPLYAEAASLHPYAERLDGVTVRLRCSSWLECYDALELVVAAAFSYRALEQRK